jgi:hypothetical protein
VFGQVLASESQTALSALRQAITAAVGDHDVPALTANKPDWRYFVFPQRPVAGADVVIYLNKSTNDMLRYSMPTKFDKMIFLGLTRRCKSHSI